jgi:23S rRNA maturation mini-RNase III
LAEVELGNAPPLEIVAKNLNANPEEYRNQTELNDILKNGPNYVKQTQKRIKEIVEEVIKEIYF